MYMGKFLMNRVIDTQSIRQNVILSCESIFIVTSGDLKLVITFLSIIPASLVYIYIYVFYVNVMTDIFNRFAWNFTHT